FWFHRFSVRFRASPPFRDRSIGRSAGSDPAGSRFDPWSRNHFVMRASFNWTGHCATNAETWRFESFRPYHFRPVAQLDRAHPSEGCDPGSNPGGPTRLDTVTVVGSRGDRRTNNALPRPQVRGCPDERRGDG